MDLHDPQKREKKKKKKKRQLGEYTAIITSRVDKNVYLFAFIIDRLSFLSVSCFWFLSSNDKDTVFKGERTVFLCV